LRQKGFRAGVHVVSMRDGPVEVAAEAVEMSSTRAADPPKVSR
jgi:hypothetical protein